MAKAPSESRIPTFGSRIPIPGKFRFLPNLTIRNPQQEPCQPSTNVKSENKTNIVSDKPPPEIDRTVTIPPTAKPEIMSPPSNTQRTCNKTISFPKPASENIANPDANCTVTLDANAAEATFMLKCATREHSQTQTIAQAAVSSGITAQDIGKRVCVGNAQAGKLCYLGEVRFNAGLWCGVELDDAVGKHDGCVKGVRYFTCRADCGILAPAVKVTLLSDNKPTCDTTFKKVISDDFGPYSLLQVDDVRVNSNDALNCDETALNKTLVLSEEVRAEQNLANKINPEPALLVRKNRLSVITSNITGGNVNLNQSTSCTPPSENSFICALNASTPMPDRKGKVKKKSIDDNCSYSPDKINVTAVRNIDLNKNVTPVHSPVETPSLTKQNSFELDESSLGILTPDQMVDFSSFGTFAKNTEAVSSDDLKSILTKSHKRLCSTSRTPSSENLGSLPKEGFKLPSSSVTITSSANNTLTQDQMISSTGFDALKSPSSEDLNTLLSSNKNITIRKRKTSTSRSSSENLCLELKFPTNSVTLNCSKVCDESSSIILSPGQIVNTTVLDFSKISSSEDLKSIVSSKRGYETISNSRSPSSENLESLKFPTNSVTLDYSKVCDESSLMNLTPEQMVTTFSKTPSSEDLKSVISSIRSDKTISNSRTPSSENLGSLPHDGFKQPIIPIEVELKEEGSLPLTRPYSIDLKSSSDPVKSLKLSASIQAELSSPNAVENSMIDFSLGLIEEDILAPGNQLSSLLDTTTNLELPLDSISGDKLEQFKSLSRSDQTPSPEDLPLDPIDPIKPVELDILDPNLLIPSTDSEPKTDVSKSTTTTKTSSFITSVTSITSLDTGYQGDGEMSRPASRGADHSPMAHKPNNPALVNLQWQRAIARRQDPMTDSDFFTESDADIHEENAPKGDRRAQVIDGTLYGVNAQAPAAQDIFIGNQEEMDSSGVFTDLDNPRADDFSDGERNRMDVVNEDKSPSEISTKSITENSQEIKETDDLESTLVNENQDISIMEVSESVSEKPKSPTQSIASNPSSRKSVRTRTPQSKEENPSKKLKMPKRNVTSKVKTMMEQQKQNDVENQEPRKVVRKTTSKWDAVMNKISQGKEENKSKIRLKEVKSKVATGISSSLNTTITRSETRKAGDSLSSAKTKIRRVRTRGDSLAATKTKPNSSVHSSLSDLSISQASHSSKKKALVPPNRVTKKRETGLGRCATPVTEVLTPGGQKPPVMAPRTNLNITQRTTKELKKSPQLSVQTVPAASGDKTAGRRTPSRRPGVGANAHKNATATAPTVAKEAQEIVGES